VIEWIKDTKKMKRRDQVVISRIQTGYTMATHGYIINKQENNNFPFCNVRLTDGGTHFMGLQRDKGGESKIQHPKQHLGKDGMKQLVEYVIKINLEKI
jgi:hypothetical protein